MRTLKKKTNRAFKKFFSVLMLALMMVFIPLAGSPAAQTDTVKITAETCTDDSDENHVMTSADFELIPSIHAHAAEEGGAAGGSADSSFTTVINFFVKWIGRIGGVVAFVGAVMFALAIKNNDAEQKQSALLTMIAGFVAAAVAGASSMFNMFG
jgi:hypothetical protein